MSISIIRRKMLKTAGSTLLAAGLPSGVKAADRPTAVVIGAGIAGLSAAYELQKGGFSVSVMEKNDYIGGRMRDAWLGPIYTPPHAVGVLNESREIFSLAEEVGISHEFSGSSESDSYSVDNGIGVYRASLKFDLASLLKIPGFSDATLKKLPILQNELAHFKENIDPSQLATGAEFDTETVNEYFVRVLGRDAASQFMDYWIDTFLNPWGWSRDKVSSVAVIGWMAHGQPTVTPRAGIGVLTRRLGDLIRVQTRTTVRYVSPADSKGRHTIHYLTPELEAKTITPDVVICATEGKYIPEMIQGLDSRDLEFFKRIDFNKTVGVSFVLRKNVDPAGMTYTRTHPDPHKSQIWAWYTSPAGTRHPDNPPRLTVHLHRYDENVEKWQRSGQSQPDYCLPLLKAIYPNLLESNIVDTVTLGCEQAAYMPRGYIAQMADVIRRQESNRRGIYFAGEYMAGAHTAAACASGRQVARTIMKHWS